MSRRVAGTLAGVASAVALLAPAASPAIGASVIAAVPGSRFTTYATPVLVVDPGESITFVNAELFPHNVRSSALGPDDAVHCGPVNPDEDEHPVRNPRRFALGACPLLWTLSIAPTTGATEAMVFGTENLVSGTEVEFRCTVHPEMLPGTILVR